MARIKTAQSQHRTGKRGAKRGPGKFSSTRAKAGLGGPTGRSPGAVRIQKRNLT
jgi:hypothetical protein